MSRTALRAAALTVILSAWAFQTVSAQAPGSRHQISPPKRFPGASRLARLLPFHKGTPARAVRYSQPTAPVPDPRARANRVTPGYPYLNAPLYTSPVQHVPYQVGGTLITNQAFAPHEMLYPHTYRAMYGPYYFRVNGSWMVSPWGVWSRDTWKLQGTEVEVKYRSKVPLLAGFVRPSIH